MWKKGCGAVCAPKKVRLESKNWGDLRLLLHKDTDRSDRARVVARVKRGGCMLIIFSGPPMPRQKMLTKISVRKRF